MGQVEEEDAGESADQEDDVKPAVVEVKLQFSQYLSHYSAVLQRHAHPHQEHRRHKIHALQIDSRERERDATPFCI